MKCVLVGLKLESYVDSFRALPVSGLDLIDISEELSMGSEIHRNQFMKNLVEYRALGVPSEIIRVSSQTDVDIPYGILG